MQMYIFNLHSRSINRVKSFIRYQLCSIAASLQKTVPHWKQPHPRKSYCNWYQPHLAPGNKFMCMCILVTWPLWTCWRATKCLASLPGLSFGTGLRISDIRTGLFQCCQLLRIHGDSNISISKVDRTITSVGWKQRFTQIRSFLVSLDSFSIVQ